MEKVKNKEHKKRTYPRIGDIATFLAKDINFFFDSPDEKIHLNSLPWNLQISKVVWPWGIFQ